MLVTIPFFKGDKHQAIHLAKWLAQLGGLSAHTCLLAVDRSTTAAGVIEPLSKVFKSVEQIWVEPVSSKGQWGDGTTDASGPNESFLTAANYIYHVHKCPWFMLEPDAVPLVPGWLDQIEKEYLDNRKPFMGAYVNIPPHEPHMSGVAVYPADISRFSLSMMVPDKIAWDYAGRHDTVGKNQAHFTKKIQHEYRIHGESPTFPTMESLSVIKPETLVFHRCKDSSLIDRVREKRAQETPAEVVTETPEERKERLFSEALAEIERLKGELVAARSEISSFKKLADLPDPKPAKKGKLKINISPEERQKRGERMKKMWETRNAKKLAKQQLVEVKA